MRKILLIIFTMFSLFSFAQKKPLDHSVYDGWQSIGEKLLSNDGKFLAYAVVPQEGDGVLYIQSVDGSFTKEIPRGYGPVMTDDSRYIICKIKPRFAETRDAKIKKKKVEDMPKDSLAILELGKDNLVKVARIKSFAVPDESGNWLAYHLEKNLPASNKPNMEPDSASRVQAMLSMADSLQRISDSLHNKVNEIKMNGMAVLRKPRKDSPPSLPQKPEEPFEEGSELILKNLSTGESRSYPLVNEYRFNKKGNVLIIETTRKKNEAASKASITRLDLSNNTSAVVFSGFHDAKSFQMDETGKQLAFIAERDSSSKSLRKFYKLYYFASGYDSARMIADKNTKGLPANWTISDNANISFSKSGNRLLVGTAPILPVKDTTLPEFDRVSVDIWHYNDDYIQPVQLKTLNNDLKRNYPASVDVATGQLVQLGNERFRNVLQAGEGDGKLFYTSTDFGKRIAAQWQGYTFTDLYTLNPENGQSELIVKDFKGNVLQASPSGKYLLFYDEIKSGYFVYNSMTQKTSPVARDITTSLADEENDVPDEPNAYGIVRWLENDKYVYVYDRYDIWQVDPEGVERSVNLTLGRKNKLQSRYVPTDRDEKNLQPGQKILLRIFDEKEKRNGLASLDLSKKEGIVTLFLEPVNLGFSVQKAKDADVLLYTKESFETPTNVFVQNMNGKAVQLSNTNPQQAEYNWGTSELFRWKAYTGKEAEGILYKPEDFDPKKKYPMIVYFYERNNTTLHNYQAPAPTPSRLNIPFFVSRGYIVFVPDIWYKKGYPGQGGYDYIVSGTRAVVKQGFVDSTKIGLQGQSWGGFQIVYLITKTNMFAAAWAGAPVANMTSAYGGIRWGSGLLRQFQYEKTQSRIGATLWERPDLYLANSALFSLPKVKTPLVIMANDADDAVPWYQGIEMYSGMRRLGKKVWMLTYNGEAHNLVERKNRKDIQIREQQFFDYMLKGDKPAKWISDGVPAIMKGRDLGLGYHP